MHRLELPTNSAVLFAFSNENVPGTAAQSVSHKSLISGWGKSTGNINSDSVTEYCPHSPLCNLVVKVQRVKHTEDECAYTAFWCCTIKCTFIVLMLSAGSGVLSLRIVRFMFPNQKFLPKKFWMKRNMIVDVWLKYKRFDNLFFNFVCWTISTSRSRLKS